MSWTACTSLLTSLFLMVNVIQGGALNSVGGMEGTVREKSSYWSVLNHQQSGKEPHEIKITGVIVGYDNGAELEGGSCWQAIMLRVNNPRIKSVARYVIVRYVSNCMDRIPESKLLERRQHRLSVVRNRHCDQLLDGLLYFRSMNPTGRTYEIPLLKLLPGAQKERIPKDRKLSCYLLRSGLP